MYARQALNREVEYLGPGSVVPEETDKEDHPALGWTMSNAKGYLSVDADNKVIWPESFTALSDFEIARVVLAVIKTSEIGRLWPVTFDTNGDLLSKRRTKD